MYGISPFCGAPFCGLGADLEEILATLTFTSTGTANYQINQVDTLTLVQVLTAISVSLYPIEDALVFVESHILNYTHLDEFVDTLTFIQTAFQYFQINQVDSFTLTQDNVFAWGLSATQSLTLTQLATVNNIYAALNEDTIEFIHSAVLNFIHNLELCGCIVLNQSAGEYIALSITQMLIFVLSETLGVEQTLEFLDSLDTNFDSSCCGDIYGIPERELSSTVTMTQGVTVGGTFGQTITHDIDLFSTALWRV